MLTVHHNGTSVTTFTDIARDGRAAYPANNAAREAMQIKSTKARRQIFSLAAVLIGLLGCAPDNARTYNDRGNAYAREGQYERAIQDFDQAIHLEPDNALAFFNRGLTYNRKGQYDRAIQDFDRAINLKPDFANAYLARGNDFTLSGQYDRAILDYDQAISLQPDNALAFSNRGFTYYLKGQIDRATQDFDQAIRLKPSVAYSPIERYIVRARLGQADRETLRRQTMALDHGKWPWPIVAFYLGDIDAVALDAAARRGDAREQNENVCQANFYRGEQLLIDRDVVAARGFLKAAEASCPRNVFEYAGAKVELDRIGR